MIGLWNSDSQRSSALQSVEKGETNGEAAKTSLSIPLAARFAHRLVFAAWPFVSHFSTDWNAEPRRLQFRRHKGFRGIRRGLCFPGKILKFDVLKLLEMHHHVILCHLKSFTIPSGGPLWLLGEGGVVHAHPAHPLPTGLCIITASFAVLAINKEQGEAAEVSKDGRLVQPLAERGICAECAATTRFFRGVELVKENVYCTVDILKRPNFI